MSVPVPFGQFVPVDSPVHRLDARVKIGLLVAYTLVLFATDSWWVLAGCAGLAALAVGLSSVPATLALRGIRPILWLALLTVVLNALTWRDPGAWMSLGPLGVDAAGLARGLYFGARIVVLVLASTLLTLTTSPVALTDAFGQLMRPLGVVRFPVDDVAMMLSIALRFVPTVAEEAERIVVAQTARGARFDQGGPLRRARAWIPVLVPLFVNLFRRADDLATAMESRCYRGAGRTRLREPRMRMADWLVLAAGVTGAVVVSILL